MLETAAKTPLPAGTSTVDQPVLANIHNHFVWGPIALIQDQWPVLETRYSRE